MSYAVENTRVEQMTDRDKLILDVETDPMNDPQEIRVRFQKQIQAVVDAGACPMEPTTVVDLVGEEPRLVRRGRGDPARLGLYE